MTRRDTAGRRTAGSAPRSTAPRRPSRRAVRDGICVGYPSRVSKSDIRVGIRVGYPTRISDSDIRLGYPTRISDSDIRAGWARIGSIAPRPLLVSSIKRILTPYYKYIYIYIASEEVPSPLYVGALFGCRCRAVACGAAHTFALTGAPFRRRV